MPDYYTEKVTRMSIHAFYASKQVKTHHHYPLTLYFEPDTKIYKLGTGERGSWGSIRSTIKRLLAILSPIPEKRFPINFCPGLGLWSDIRLAFGR
jgi:hypothetical protein